ncbi:uncharacterized protein [Rutidosis leptorrhynchoides]|uniref:uncharacterized protein n=1 Tax=Rutidosis leptorrhynchoides TaxID=125765 RepID=UPI003A99906A
MYRDVAKIVKSCKSIERHAPQNRKSRHDMILVNSPWPFYKWATDIVGPFPAEAKALCTITWVQVQNFVWEHIICRFGIPHEIANGLCKVINHDIVGSIKKRLNEKRTRWVDELSNVLWAHRRIFKKSTGETSFSLVYGSEAMISAEIFMPTHRVANFDETKNNDALCENLNFVEERRLMV